MNQPPTKYKLGLALVTAAAVAWSLSGLFTRAISTDTSTILFWRGTFGALGLLLLIVFIPGTGALKDFRELGLRGWVYAAITSASMLLFIGALRQTSVAHVAVITASVPFMAAALGWLFLRERPELAAILTSLFAFVGVAIMVGVGGEGAILGDVLAMLMAMCMGAMILLARRFGNTPALATTCLASLLTAFATLPLANVVNVTGFELSVLASFAIVNQVLGFGLFALGARHLPLMHTALITALDAPLAPLWVLLVFHELPNMPTVIGGSIVMIAVFWFIYSSSRKSTAK